MCFVSHFFRSTLISIYFDWAGLAYIFDLLYINGFGFCLKFRPLLCLLNQWMDIWPVIQYMKIVMESIFFWLNRFISEFILFQQFSLSTYSFFLSRHIYYWMHAGRVIHLQRSFVMVIAVWFIFLLKYSFIQANFCVCPTHHHFYQWMMYGLEMVVQIDANHTSINLTTRQKSRLYLDLQFSITNFAIKVVATYADPIHPCITFCILWLFARK